MELVTGGSAMGKTAYVRSKYPHVTFLNERIFGEEKIRVPWGTTAVVNGLHRHIRVQLLSGKSMEEMEKILRKRITEIPSLVFVTDEIGCGIVPMDPFERRWREVTGRIATDLAKEAETVTRVHCGIPMILKRQAHPSFDVSLIRHGKTPGNEKRRYIGRTDEPLSERGKAELAVTKRSLEELGNLSTDACRAFRSPMLRCRQTAEILFPGILFTPVEDLRETDFGTFEGKNAEELSRNPDYQRWIDSGGTLPFPEGESREAFIRRSVLAFFSCLEAPGRYLFVVHGGTIMSVLSFVTGQDYFRFQVPNGDGYVLSLHRENGVFLADHYRRLLS